MRRFGLIGKPLTHSFSRSYFTDKFKNEGIADCRYDNFPLDSVEEVRTLLQDIKGLEGLNVTIPFKEQVLPFLDEIDIEADNIGAVNAIKVREGRTKGYNTDIYGFVESLRPLVPDVSVKALVLGSGGASKAVIYGLDKMNISYRVVSRSEGGGLLGYSDLDENVIAEHCLIINTTPLGMFPNMDECPQIPYSAINENHILYDLIYNPEKSLFLELGERKGARIKNGLEMLHLQAERSWDIWNQPSL